MEDTRKSRERAILRKIATLRDLMSREYSEIVQELPIDERDRDVEAMERAAEAITE